MQRVLEIFPHFGESFSLSIYAGYFFHIGHIPATALFEYRSELALHADILARRHFLCMAERNKRADGYRGMLPCFLRGLVSRLFSRERRAVMSLARVSAGMMMASMYPRSAAT